MTIGTENSVAWLVDVPPDEMRRIVDALYRVHSLVSSITDLDSLLETIMEESKQLASAEASALLLHDTLKGDLYFHVALGEQGNQQALKQQVRLTFDDGIAGACARTRESINVTDAAQDPRVFREADALSEFQTRSLLAVPLIDRDDLIGVLEVVNKVDGGTFTDVDRRILEVFASLAASVIANARLIEDNLRSERMAAIGLAVAGLSHYTKNILAGMMASAEIIDTGMTSNDLTMLQTGWDVLKRSIGRISEVVQDMLTYSKPRELQLEACNLKEIIEDARANVETIAQQKKVAIHIDLQTQGTMQLDGPGMFRCLLNLLGNAVDAAPTGHGRVDVYVGQSPAGDLRIEILDNGPGVAEENLDAIFEPFFSTKGSRGTGLGLAVTRKVIEEHGGTISARANPGGGARFIIDLPQPDTAIQQK